jgi:transcriptional regulator with AAA-type ATPase domain
MNEISEPDQGSEMVESKTIDPVLFDSIRTLLYRDHLPIESIKEILVKSGARRGDISKAYKIILKHNTEADKKKEEKLIWEKPLLVPPGLSNAVCTFEDHFAVSGDQPIMILGPPGVGKTLFLYLAKQLFREAHQNEERVPPIIEANCGHFAGRERDVNITRSELFGHVRGAYSGAIKDKEGLVHDANGGFLILEEIGELPPETQAMLLTFIETGEYRRVGENVSRTAKVKIVGATNHESDLRKDFKYRFFPYYIPPLRERKGDILYYFFEMFHELAKKLTRAEVLLLLSHHWPGTVREVERIGRLLMREKKSEDAAAKNSQFRPSSPRIYYLDPKEMTEESFDPSALDNLSNDLKLYDVDLNFLEKLFKSHRISLNSDEDESAFMELAGMGVSKAATKEGTKEPVYSTWFDQYTLKFCEEFEPFEEAYRGYFCFCGLFLQNPVKDKNILTSLTDCDVSHFSIDELKFAESDKGRIQGLGKNIMRYLKRVEFLDNELPANLSSMEYWDALETMTDDYIPDDQHRDALREISGLKEKELLRLYYQTLLDRSYGNVRRAAGMAGLAESTFRDRMKAVGVKFRKKDRGLDRENTR